MSGHESTVNRQTMLERSVAASVIMGDALPSALGLEEAHFADPLCRRLFVLTAQMEKRRQEISLPDVCMADETLDAGAVVSLVQEHCISEVILRQHCALLRDLSERRSLETLLEQTLAALRAGGDTGETIDSLRTRLAALLDTGRADCGGASMLELIIAVLDQMESREALKPAIACGIGKIDDCLNGGFRAGDLVVVAALTSVGKSAMLSFMMRNAAEQGKRVLLISCEMSDEQNAERFMASISGVDLGRIVRRETLSEEENISLSDGMERYHPECIRVISSGTQTAASVRREALKMKMTEGLDMIVVDYLQRLRPDSGRSSRAEEVGSIAAALKSMAVDLDVPVLTAAQFNREAAKGRREALGNENEGIPALHQLRDSSQIEDEANTVITLDEPVRAPGNGIRQINAHIVKNRSGALQAVHLLFDPRKMTYAAV